MSAVHSWSSTMLSTLGLSRSTLIHQKFRDTRTQGRYYLISFFWGLSFSLLLLVHSWQSYLCRWQLGWQFIRRLPVCCIECNVCLEKTRYQKQEVEIGSDGGVNVQTASVLYTYCTLYLCTDTYLYSHQPIDSITLLNFNKFKSLHSRPLCSVQVSLNKTILLQVIKSYKNLSLIRTDTKCSLIPSLSCV